MWAGALSSCETLRPQDESAGWCVRLIAPAGVDLAAVHAFEDVLTARLSIAGGEVDGDALGDDAIEAFVYGADIAGLLATSRIRWSGVPVNSQLGGGSGLLGGQE